jgi:hypothetical protein
MAAQDSLNDSRSGLPSLERQRNDLAALRLHFLTTHNLVTSPVPSFNQHVWRNRLDEIQRRAFIKHGDITHALQSGEHDAPLLLAQNGSVLSLEFSHRAVTVNADDQCVTKTPRSSQIDNMPGMQNVKTAVRENDLSTGLSQLHYLPHQGFMIEDFFQTAPRGLVTQPQRCATLVSGLNYSITRC